MYAVSRFDYKKTVKRSQENVTVLKKDQIIEQARRYIITTPEASVDHLLPVKFMKGKAEYAAFAPKEQIRLKMKGSGLNFVHGGVSL